MVQPVWITSPGSLGTIPQGVFYSVPLAAYDPLHTDTVYYEVIAGNLPPGVACTSDGLIAGVPQEVAISTTNQFCVRAYTEETIGPVTVIKALADRTFTLTIAVSGNPTFTTPEGQIAEYYDGTQVTGLQIQYSGATNSNLYVTLVSGQLPPGLTISSTGLISGYIIPTTNPPEAGGSEDYSFTLRLASSTSSSLATYSILVVNRANMTADDTFFTADNTFITADVSPITSPIILTPTGSIGTIQNGDWFAFQFQAVDPDGVPFQFEKTAGSFPPGLTLDPNSGWLYGDVPGLGLTQRTYNFTLRVFQTSDPTIISNPYSYSLTVIGQIYTGITWLVPDFLGAIYNGSTSTFYVRAININNIPLQYQLLSGSNSLLPQGLQLLPSGDIAGRVSFDTFALDGGTTTFDTVPLLGMLYYGTPTTFDLVFTFTVNAFSVNGLINVNHTFSIQVIRKYNTPYDNLYIQCMPPLPDRALINDLLQNSDIFPPALLYRKDDPNFGLATRVKYYHAYGLNPATLDTYVSSLYLNHYWKNLVLGEVKTAQAIDPETGEVIYEVVYSEIIDDLVNNAGQSVGKQVVIPYPIAPATISEVDIVYPNSLVNMRDQVIDVVGQESNILPLWMLSKQADGNVLGFTPAWVIAYTKPGCSGQIQYNIKTQFGNKLNLVDFKVDRYELDNLLTKNWDRDTQQWNPSPPTLTTFDVGIGALSDVGWVNDYADFVGWLPTGSTIPITWTTTANTYPFGTYFDGGSMQFITPVDMYSSTTDYDKYLVFPKRNILG